MYVHTVDKLLKIVEIDIIRIYIIVDNISLNIGLSTLSTKYKKIKTYSSYPHFIHMVINWILWTNYFL